MSATINSHATLHEGRVFNLVKENYTLDNGVTSHMDFIQHPGAAAMGNPCRHSGPRRIAHNLRQKRVD